jgi:hypothetical protein
MRSKTYNDARLRALRLAWINARIDAPIRDQHLRDINQK